MKHTSLTKKLFLISAFSISFSSMADQWKLEYGMAKGYFTSPFKGVKSIDTPLPIINASYKNWRFGMQHGLVQYALKNDDYEMGFGLNYRDETYQSAILFNSKKSDNEIFDGYNAPDGDVTFEHTSQYKNWQLKISQDISGNSKGLTGLANVTIPIYRFNMGVMLAADLGINYQDKNYVNHVYGITDNNIDIDLGRTHYEANSATNLVASIKAMYSLNDNMLVSLIAKNKRLDDSIKESPLVEDSDIKSVIIAFKYIL